MYPKILDFLSWQHVSQPPGGMKWDVCECLSGSIFFKCFNTFSKSLPEKPKKEKKSGAKKKKKGLNIKMMKLCLRRWSVDCALKSSSKPVLKLVFSVLRDVPMSKTMKLEFI